MLLIAAIVEAVHAFRDRRSGHLFLHSLNAALSVVVGLMLLRYPLAGATVMTLLLAVHFTVAGIFRIVSAVSPRLPHWGWALLNGVITLLLGILGWSHWPTSALWIIGLFIGIDLIFTEWAQVMLASAVRRLSTGAKCGFKSTVTKTSSKISNWRDPSMRAQEKKVNPEVTELARLSVLLKAGKLLQRKYQQESIVENRCSGSVRRRVRKRS